MKNLLHSTNFKLNSMQNFSFPIVKGSMKSTITVKEISYKSALKVACERARKLDYEVRFPVHTDLSSNDIRTSVINDIICASNLEDSNKINHLRAQLESLNVTQLTVIESNVTKYVNA